MERKLIGLNVLVLNKISLVAGKPSENDEIAQVDSKQNQKSQYCLNETHAKGQKKKTNSFGQFINKCNKAISQKEHTIKLCLECYE